MGSRSVRRGSDHKTSLSRTLSEQLSEMAWAILHFKSSVLAIQLPPQMYVNKCGLKLEPTRNHKLQHAGSWKLSTVVLGLKWGNRIWHRVRSTELTRMGSKPSYGPKSAGYIYIPRNRRCSITRVAQVLPLTNVLHVRVSTDCQCQKVFRKFRYQWINCEFVANACLWIRVARIRNK